MSVECKSVLIRASRREVDAAAALDEDVTAGMAISLKASMYGNMPYWSRMVLAEYQRINGAEPGDRSERTTLPDGRGFVPLSRRERG